MSDYGFSMRVEDLTSSQMKKIEQSIKNLGGTVKSEMAGMQNNFNNLAESAGNLQRRLIEAFSVFEIYNFGKALMHTAAEFQGFENVIKYSSEGIVDASLNIGYLENAIDRLHLPMKESFQSFSEMQAGFYGTGIEGEKLRKVFEGVAEASSVLHLNPATFSRVTFALKEIGELGTLQARQLRMLSFSLPGAGNLAAQSMGMSSEQLHEGMKKGEIKSSVFLPKFAEALTEHFHSGLGNAGNSLISQMNDEKNEMVKMMLDMGTQLTPLFTDILKTVGEAFRDIKKTFDWFNSNNALTEFLKRLFDILVKLVPIWAAYKLVVIASTFASEAFAGASAIVTGAFGAEAVAAEAAAVGVTAFETALNSTIIGAAVVSLGLMVEHFISLNQQLDDIIDKKFKLSQGNEFFKRQTSIADQIKEKYDAEMATGHPLKDALQNIANQTAQAGKMFADSIPVLKYRDSTVQSFASNSHPRSKSDRFFHGVGFPALFTSDGSQKIIDAANASKAQLSVGINTNRTLSTLQKTLLEKFGIKPTNDSYTNPGSGKDQALNTSELAGASGGLGQAKIIHITIGVVQQNNGVKESKSEANEAVQQLIRELNNLSDSQNSM